MPAGNIKAHILHQRSQVVQVVLVIVDRTGGWGRRQRDARKTKKQIRAVERDASSGLIAIAQAIGRSKKTNTCGLHLGFPKSGVYSGITLSRQFLPLRGATHRRHALYTMKYASEFTPLEWTTAVFHRQTTIQLFFCPRSVYARELSQAPNYQTLKRWRP